VASEIALIKMYGSNVMAIAINTEHCTNEEAYQFQTALKQELGLPVLLPLQEGVSKMIPLLKNLMKP
jgi:uncharacterized NAD-dependent epimerase/dehydratase family protein